MLPGQKRRVSVKVVRYSRISNTAEALLSVAALASTGLPVVSIWPWTLKENQIDPIKLAKCDGPPREYVCAFAGRKVYDAPGQPDFPTCQKKHMFQVWPYT